MSEHPMDILQILATLVSLPFGLAGLVVLLILLGGESPPDLGRFSGLKMFGVGFGLLFISVIIMGLGTMI
jgi:hypothetical protein